MSQTLQNNERRTTAFRSHHLVFGSVGFGELYRIPERLQCHLNALSFFLRQFNNMTAKLLENVINLSPGQAVQCDAQSSEIAIDFRLDTGRGCHRTLSFKSENSKSFKMVENRDHIRAICKARRRPAAVSR